MTSGLQRLKRASWRSVLQVVLLVVAVSVLINRITGIDIDSFGDELADASWWMVMTGVVVAQTPRLAQSLSTLGAAPGRIPLRPVYLLQLAQSYLALAVPSSAARIAMNIRFFQKQGFTSGSALAMGGLDSIAGFLVEMALLTGLIVLTPRSLHFDLDAPSLPEWTTIVLWVLVIAVIMAIVSWLLPDRRRQFSHWVRQFIADGRNTLSGINSPRRLALLFGGNLGSTLLFAFTLGLFARALGTTVGLSDLIVVIVAVSLLAGLIPIPGGIGVVEGGLTFGLVAAGMPEDPAFAAVILYRIATFYLPPVWGFLAFRWLERNQFL